ncbi:hypothetical protein COV18_06770 [Candidatus Woesearchaeota archaeon CG10_big_fil_rev_8_21_14_0_10_37_12]|nr:MAG: hypothetical protein COV18_06770 [Candidatus Woesearchaeota archaeon CG10_big_fil_rev_8_21_14_0_10_37_12]
MGHLSATRDPTTLADSLDQTSLTALTHLHLEVTAGCNERCVECCTDSSPETFSRDILQEYGLNLIL